MAKYQIDWEALEDGNGGYTETSQLIAAACRFVNSNVGASDKLSGVLAILGIEEAESTNLEVDQYGDDSKL